MHRDERALLENVGPHGERLDLPAGRLTLPGHAIETSWFLLREALHRRDASLQESALNILRWSLEWGWDEEHGGLLYYVDIEGLPPEQLEWDMKLWWPHTEALYALLLASYLTGDPFWDDWYRRMHSWTFAHFPDPVHGEWYGYLHRDGSLANPAKGSMWKGPSTCGRGPSTCPVRCCTACSSWSGRTGPRPSRGPAAYAAMPA